ncbi:hypothetical protein CWO04_10015 [Vibrio splendidus]|uniref:oligosaccharide flippase family protein n=1 Tax=Vibrio splendidus TaxID=29497 RepID=UPI000D392E5E|nr:lipopolysaccharide biosynthesis protein [Vibrio splendidus]PTP86654.1 hypothetical protein CWO04_10015 [Vibrio splendidus]
MKKLLSNFLSLTSINSLGLLISLVTVPLLLRNFGDEVYGQYALYFIITQFFLVVIDYGFDVLLVKKASNKGNLSELFFDTIFLRLFIFILVFVFSIGLMALIESDNKNIFSFIFLMLSNLGMVFSVTWVFQYKERMFPIALITLISRLVYLVLILLSNEISMVSVSLYYLISSIISWVCGILLVFSTYIDIKGDYKFCLKRLTRNFSQSTSIFYYRFFSSLFVPVNSAIISYMAGYSWVTYFDLFNKISGVINMISFSAVQAIYPLLTKCKTSNHVYYYFKKYTLITFLITCISILWLIVFDDFNLYLISLVFFDNKYDVNALLPSIVVFGFFVAMNSFVSRCLVIADKQNKIFFYTSISVFVALLLSPFSILFLGKDWLVLPSILFQSILFILMFNCYQKSR